MHGDPTGKHRYCDPFACELVEVKHTCSTCGARHLPPAAQKRADLNSADAINSSSKTSRKDWDAANLKDNLAIGKDDCCSGFVTQEGRDIHHALEHLPDARTGVEER